MKYVIILSDGMSDYPIEELGGKTPMEYADKPVMDSLAAEGEQFLCKTVPDGMKPGSDIANLSVMGYNPHKYYTGRSPLEAANMGVPLSFEDTAFRANLVSLSGLGEYENLIMKDYSAGEISTPESTKIIQTLSQELDTDNLKFYSGVSYRHLLVRKGDFVLGDMTPPHDISDRPIKEHLPTDLEMLNLMKKSYDLLINHPINIKRRAQGKNTADSLWIWGGGKSTSLPSFEKEKGLKGAVVSAVDLVRGIGRLSGMEVIEVEGVTGTINTNFEGKAKAALDTLLGGNDFCYVHIEAPDECGHQGQAKEKARAIEIIDEKIVKYIKDGLQAAGEDFRIMILPDHPTPISTKTHASDPVPCLIYDSTFKKNGVPKFTEKTAADSGRILSVGHELIDYFIGRKNTCNKT